jgi:hypothetical protein
MRGRVQDSITGRFLSPDPNIPDPGFTQSYNRYAYVRNNPLSYIDPSGFREQCIWEEIFHSMGIVQEDAEGNFNGVIIVPAPSTFEQKCVDVPDLFDLLTNPPESPTYADEGGGGGQAPTGTPPQSGCTVTGARQRAQANAFPSRIFGPVSFDSENEMALFEQYFRGDTTPYRLTNMEMNQAQSYVSTYGSNVLGSRVTSRSDGLTERLVFFGRIPSDAPLLDGLLGTATGVFDGDALVGLRDTFNFDFKNRGGYPYGWKANIGVALVRLDAATCAGDIKIPVSGGTQ